MGEHRSLLFTDEFFESFTDRRLTPADRAAFLKAVALLDDDDHHPSLRVHKLQGDLSGRWSASASHSLRLVFQRLPDGRKRIHFCTKHYDR